MKYSFDIIGSKEKSIAIVEIREEGLDEKRIAHEIMENHKNVVSVLKKTSERKDVIRKRDYELITGDPNTEVIHKESNCRFKLDITKTYFSNREVTERARIAEMTQPNEDVLVMFGGIAPYPIVIAKHQKEVNKIISIEINPDAHEYAKENVKLSKLEDKVFPVLGNVEEKCEEFFGKFDRVIMPLPHEAVNFLNVAIKSLKPKGGIIHLYIIEQETEVEEKIKELMGKINSKSYDIRKVLPYSPRSYKYCVDIKLGAGFQEA